MTTPTPRTDAIKKLMRTAINEPDRERQIAMREGAEFGIEQLENDLAARDAELAELNTALKIAEGLWSTSITHAQIQTERAEQRAEKLKALLLEAQRDLAAALEERDALKAAGDELARRVEGIAKWREKAHAYDRDVENEPRTFCEDVELIESAASGALNAYRAANQKDGA